MRIAREPGAHLPARPPSLPPPRCPPPCCLPSPGGGRAGRPRREAATPGEAGAGGGAGSHTSSAPCRVGPPFGFSANWRRDLTLLIVDLGGGGGVQKELWMKQQATSNPGSAFLSCVTSDRTLHGSGLPLQFSSLKGEAWAGPNCESLVLGGLAKEPARPRVQILRLLLAGCLILGGTRPLVKPQFPRLLGRLRWWWSPASCHTCRCITRYSQYHR